MRLLSGISSGFGDDAMNYEAQLAINYLIDKYGIPSCGRNRACFYSKKFVIKFPLNWYGFDDNDHEGKCRSIEYAKGRTICFDKFVCVVQERLTPYYESGIKYKDLPDWVGYIDCAQVGLDREGFLKAYDFGLR